MDLGAAWIHGVRGNPLTNLADRFGATRIPTRSGSEIMIGPGGSPPPPNVDADLDFAETIIEAAREAVDDLDNDVSLADAVTRALRRRPLTPARRAALDHHVNSIIEQEYAADWSELSAWHYDDDAEFPCQDALFAGGMQQLTDSLARGIPVLTGQTVTAITSTAQDVTVTTRDTSYHAQAVIVTVSLGVLKAGGIRFTPALPSGHRAAIAGLGMGLLNKTVLRFDRPFWPEKTDWLEHLGDQKGSWAEWTNLLPCTGKPILVGFHAGKQARVLERLDDRATIAAAMAALRDMFGPAATAPVASQTTRWAADPSTLGAYSFNAVGCSGVILR